MDPASTPIFQFDRGETICGQWLCGQRRVGHNYDSVLIPAGEEQALLTPSALGSGPLLIPKDPEVLV